MAKAAGLLTILKGTITTNAMDNTVNHHQQGSPTPAVHSNLHRRATHHGVPNPQASGASQLQNSLQGNPDIFEQEGLRHMFSRLQAYNTFEGARHITNPQFQYGPGPAPGPEPSTASAQPSMWTNGTAAHLQPPVFTHEQFQSNPFTGQAVVSDFGGAFASPLGVLGNPKTPTYTSPTAPRPTSARTVSGVQDSPTARSENNASFVANPLNLDAWRERLFHLEEMVILTQQQ